MRTNEENHNQTIIKFIKSLFTNNDLIPLHEPKFIGNEKKYLKQCVDSTFVSSIGRFVVIQPSIYEYSHIFFGLKTHGRLKLALTASDNLPVVKTFLSHVSKQVATICSFMFRSSIITSQKILSNNF